MRGLAPRDRHDLCRLRPTLLGSGDFATPWIHDNGFAKGTLPNRDIINRNRGTCYVGRDLDRRYARAEIREGIFHLVSAVGSDLISALGAELFESANRGDVVVELSVTVADVVEKLVTRSERVGPLEFHAGSLVVCILIELEPSGKTFLRLFHCGRGLRCGWRSLRRSLSEC